MRYSDSFHEERRVFRRKRRRRNQVIAYLALLLILALAAAGAVYGVKIYTEKQKQVQQEEQEKQDNQAAVEDLLESEEPIQLETTVETVPEPTPEEKLEALIEESIAAMPLEDKVAGLFLVTPEAITGVTTAIKAGDGTKAALEKYAVGGLVYFSKNIQNREQLMSMISGSQNFSGYPLFIAVDEEGGSVSRIGDSGLASGVESAEAIAGTLDPANAYQAGATIGTYLTDLGFNLNFAPVADLANVENSVMGSRSYGSDPAVVSSFVTSMMQGLEEQNVTACLKHFPGLGSTTDDTHNGIAVSSRTAEEFRSQEFAVFRAGIDAGANMIMVGHMAAPSLTGDNTPASMSSVIVTDILRKELGFEGVIITDAMNMSAISNYHAADHAAISALKAGCDMILMPDDFELAYNGVLQAVQEGIIAEERVDDSLRRIYWIKYGDRLEE